MLPRAILATLFLLVIISCVPSASCQPFTNDVPPTPPIFGVPVEDVGEGVRDLVQLAKPAVVRINISGGYYGSGVIFAVDGSTGYVLTNQHVIDGATSINVTVNDATAFRGTVVGVDDTRDLAVLSICCRTFRALPFADAGLLRAGDEVIAMGYPLGLPGSATVTRGIVSAVRYDASRAADVIQTDAAINPGNSGGPLLSVDGHILGIMTYGYDTAADGRPVEGLSFAVSERTIQARLSDLGYSGRLVAAVIAARPTATPRPTVAPTLTARPVVTSAPTSLPAPTPVKAWAVGPELQAWNTQVQPILELLLTVNTKMRSAFHAGGEITDRASLELSLLRISVQGGFHWPAIQDATQVLGNIHPPNAEARALQQGLQYLLDAWDGAAYPLVNAAPHAMRTVFAGFLEWEIIEAQALDLAQRWPGMGGG